MAWSGRIQPWTRGRGGGLCLRPSHDHRPRRERGNSALLVGVELDLWDVLGPALRPLSVVEQHLVRVRVRVRVGILVRVRDRLGLGIGLRFSLGR